MIGYSCSIDDSIILMISAMIPPVITTMNALVRLLF